MDASSVEAGISSVTGSLEAAEAALNNIDYSNMDEETAAAVASAINSALGSVQAAEATASGIDTSTITASAPDTSALQAAASTLKLCTDSISNCRNPGRSC